MKKYLFGILAITMAVSFSAFTTKNSAKKPFNFTDFYYVAGKSYQRIEQGHSSAPAITFSLNETTFRNANLSTSPTWQLASVSYTQDNDMTLYIGKIRFNLDDVANDGTDGAVTLQEALDAVWDKYKNSTPNPYVMPTSVTVTSADAVVTIEAKSAATPEDDD